MPLVPAGETPLPRIGGRFELVRLLGQGATSRVDAAWDHQDADWVALKRIDLRAFDGHAALFEREVASLRLLQHPDIAALIASGIEGHFAWLALALAPGVDLSRYTQPARVLPLPVVLGLAERIARALSYAHLKGVVHRDLKPANLRLHWASDRLTLLDFGLARTADAAATRTGLVPGTPAYMAPELLAGALPSPASDLYALGATLFHLLTGRLPHQADSLGALLQRVASQAAPDLRESLPAASSALADLVAALLAREPLARPADALAVAAALARERLLSQAAAHGPMSRG